MLVALKSMVKWKSKNTLNLTVNNDALHSVAGFKILSLHDIVIG
jgi:hypothetical protein